MCPYHESPYFSINAHAVSSDRVPAETLWSTAVKDYAIFPIIHSVRYERNLILEFAFMYQIVL
jgi:hypothetical protein